MKHRLLLLFTLLLCFATNMPAQSFTLTSPDQTITLTIAVDGGITYALSIDGQEIMNPSRISMTINGEMIPQGKLKRKKGVRQSVDQVLEPIVWQKTRTIRDHYNELTLAFKGDHSVVFRAYDNGVAYRFQTAFEDESKVNAESAEFNFAGKNHIYFPEEESYFSHNERTYLHEPVAGIAENRFCSLPAVVATEAGPNILITETALLDYPGMWLGATGSERLNARFPAYALQAAMAKGSDRDEPVTEYADYLAETQGTRSFPWRILGIARTDGELITNQLSFQLAAPQVPEDFSWIQPGKVAWDWFNYNNIYGVDFKAGVNTETYKYYIDFASRYGLEYVILDEGWYELGDLLKVQPGVDVEEIIAYGKQKNVGIILWVIWKTLDNQLQEAMDQFEKWGVKGIKVDFMQRDDQWMVNYYKRIAEEAAKRKMLVDFHGSYKPAGLRRTYPNVITREGVKGLEWNKWSSEITPEHNVTIPFIRMAAGPLDYTPGAMLNAQKENFNPVFNRPMSMTTRCQQMAMYVVYESPLQMLSDNPTHYLREAECTEFIAGVPTTWEDTRVLAASIGDYICIARKRDNQWFIGAMTDSTARDLTISLDFLEEGEKMMVSFQDGMNADRYASDYKKQVRTVSKGDQLTIKLAKGGGWVARIY